MFWQLEVLHIDKQLKLFGHYQQRLSLHIGEEEAKKVVNKAIVLIILGGNDFVNNYYLVPFSARSRQFSLPDYVTYLISEYRKILRVSYNHFTINTTFETCAISLNNHACLCMCRNFMIWELGRFS